ncbi:ATP-dependent RecD-like DNA helicase [Aquisphaera giovannonii]|uniref:ATP-dependent RecD-like DNA helicase n=1 Tax=Aquisphaera giovannonii TaxID=406548 RepID=A0A5B9W7J1_9BACT|nr:ATP-dependent RecD-like DNA helicase [Aquisphaera giovannonii]QEH36523.1 ATP-dependent RecD-like DNA helicase [Aquisphaera giovannonii]
MSAVLSRVPALPSPNIIPSGEQSGAISDIVSWYRDRRGRQEFYVAGFAGVGKSVTANLAIEELKATCGVRNVRTAAYTGKAASVLRKKGVECAQTIHSLIYTAVEDEETGEVHFILSDDSPAADADLIVLDEVSMVNKEIADDLRSFGKKILVLGDPGQLPPVSGEGAFTNREPDVFLREIHRQAAGSPIIELATLARQGKPLPKGYEKDGVRVLPLTKESQPLIYREETQPICGLNRVRWVYNQRIRKLRGFEGETPQAGEKIICCRNNRDTGLFNGGMGTTLAAASEHEKLRGAWLMDVRMEDLRGPNLQLAVDPYLFRRNFTNGHAEKLPLRGTRLEEFDFGYTITCHKAQGSSWDDVTVIDDSSAFRDNRNLWKYTAITRAERGLTVLLRES